MSFLSFIISLSATAFFFAGGVKEPEPEAAVVTTAEPSTF